MTDSASVSREHNGSGSTGTLDNDTTTFAILEVLIPWDATNMKSQWRGYGFTDISPLWADKPQVPTFMSDPKVIARWPEFQAEFCGVDAHWYYVSGHHSRRYASDGVAEATEELMVPFAATYDQAGFFNEPYHDGPWAQDNADTPPPGRSGPKDVFFCTAQDGVTWPPCAEDNPLYDHVRSGARGVFLAGCYSLAFTQVRKMLIKYFPNAVVFGTLSRESNSGGSYLKIGKKYGKKFYTEPYNSDLTVPLLELLNKARNVEFDDIAILHNGFVWYLQRDGYPWYFDGAGPTPWDVIRSS